MDCANIIKLVKIALLSSVVATSQIAYAGTDQSPTIEDASLEWGDANARIKLLSVVPKWSPQAIKLLFEEYKHPERHQLPAFINGLAVNYNALFINAFWGPRDNPFVKLPRPAKVFIFVKGSDGTKKYFMAPIMQDENDKNYYVFDKAELQPIPLKLWVYNKTDGYPCSVKFNVCTGYGVLPQDTCEGKDISSEIYRDPQELVSKPIPTIRYDSISASRHLRQDWHIKANMSRPKKSHLPQATLDMGTPWKDISRRQELLQTVATWPNYKIIKSNFAKIRDLRYFTDEAMPGFMRRLSWLYPDDGCWTRTGAIFKSFFGPLNNVVNAYSRPSKIFAFGNLCLNTPNTPTGRISWWYHFAAIVRDAETNQAYVLDPSVDATAPLPVEKWVESISSNTGSCSQGQNSISSFSICNGYGTNPFDRCELTSSIDFENEIRAEIFDKYFRKFERNRQLELGRDPNKVLGDTPPWQI